MVEDMTAGGRLASGVAAACAFLAASCVLSSPACAYQQFIHPITGYHITIMNPTPTGALFGWLELVNGNQQVGYVYLEDADLSPPHGGAGYIVMHMPWSQLGNLLTVLKSGEPLQIRLYDPQTPGVLPSAFIESVGSNVAQPLAQVTPQERGSIAKHIPGMPQ